MLQTWQNAALFVIIMKGISSLIYKLNSIKNTSGNQYFPEEIVNWNHKLTYKTKL